MDGGGRTCKASYQDQAANTELKETESFRDGSSASLPSRHCFRPLRRSQHNPDPRPGREAEDETIVVGAHRASVTSVNMKLSLLALAAVAPVVLAAPAPKAEPAPVPGYGSYPPPAGGYGKYPPPAGGYGKYPPPAGGYGKYTSNGKGKSSKYGKYGGYGHYGTYKRASDWIKSWF
ncbi:hypothetical protein B0J13DRAFT_626124 [Dactylonectria estremocensis]|uniref:Uncharacterized protein n=1 Tax=Dactylonectria estremocensis TaxID=1079267 RepID=A0A9P9E8N8_9HYPO|nr:hypothetical protein B0J13DRAFT_626124 [Dactylonectria estremocensis]